MKIGSKTLQTRVKVLRTFDWKQQPTVHRCGACKYNSSRRYDITKHRAKCAHY